jgi:hypothetical protein
MKYPIPDNEVEGIAAVQTYHVTDRPPEVAYDDIAALASG